MYVQQMGAHLACNYVGKVLQKELRAPYLTTYVFQALSPLDYTKIMYPIKKFSVLIINVPSKLSSGRKNFPFLATLYFYRAILLIVLCSLHTECKKRKKIDGRPFYPNSHNGCRFKFQGYVRLSQKL